MATPNRTTVWTTLQTLTSAALNNEFNNLLNNLQLTNDDISAGAAIATSKISFGGTNGQYVKSNGSGGITYASLVVNRGFAWTIRGPLGVANTQGAIYVVPQTMTCVKVHYKTTSGSAVFQIVKNGSAIFSATATTGATSGTVTTALAINDVLTLNISSVSSGVDLSAHLEVTQP